jgi:Protein of unknown function (DUF2934)
VNAVPKPPQRRPAAAPDWHEAIQRRAEEIYIRNGKIPGRDLQNWAQAEQEILHESAEPQPQSRRTAIVVKVDGTAYVGEYDPSFSDGYLPGEFGPGVSVPVRFSGDRMYLKRPNGKILETTIVKKID